MYKSEEIHKQLDNQKKKVLKPNRLQLDVLEDKAMLLYNGL